MQYKIEPIGTEFSDKEIMKLENRLNVKASEGYELTDNLFI